MKAAHPIWSGLRVLPAFAAARHNHHMLPRCPACHKNIFASRAEAGVTHNLGFGKQQTGLQPYRCPVGNGWHLGHHSTNRKRPPVGESRRNRMLSLPRYALAREWNTREIHAQ